MVIYPHYPIVARICRIAAVVSVLFGVGIVPSFGQEKPTTAVVDTLSGQEPVYTTVEAMPQFPGGQQSLYRFLGSQTRYPPSALRAGEQGEVLATFVVDAQGKVRDVRITRGISPALDAETLRVFRLMPDWQPGREKGRAVAVQVIIPFKFVIS